MGRSEDIDNAIWADPDFRKLSADARYLYLWAFTNPSCGMAGLYRLDTGRAAFDTGMTEARVAKAADELAATAYVVLAEPWVWVRTRVKHLRTRSVPMLKSVVNDLRHLKADDPLRHRIVAELVEIDWLRRQDKDGRWDEYVQETRSTEPDSEAHPRLTRGSVEGHQTLKGTGKGKGNSSDSRAHAAEAADDAPPDGLPPALVSTVEAVKAVLDRVCAAKLAAGKGEGALPTLLTVGRVVASHECRGEPRDYLAEAETLEQWFVHGTGRKQTNKDVVARYRSWLGNADKRIAPALRAPVDHQAAAAERTRRALEAAKL